MNRDEKRLDTARLKVLDRRRMLERCERAGRKEAWARRRLAKAEQEYAALAYSMGRTGSEITAALAMG